MKLEPKTTVVYFVRSSIEIQTVRLF